MILETFHTERLPNGYVRRETRSEEFDSLEEVEAQLMLYRLAEIQGFRIYDCTQEDYLKADRDTHLINHWYNREAIIRIRKGK